MTVKNDPRFAHGQYNKVLDRKHPRIEGLRYKVEWTNASGLNIPLEDPGKIISGLRGIPFSEKIPFIHSNTSAYNAMIEFCDYETKDEINDFVLRLLTKKTFFININIEVYAKGIETAIPVLGEYGSKIFGYSSVDKIETDYSPKQYIQKNPEFGTWECLDALLQSAVIDYRSSIDELLNNLRTTAKQLKHLGTQTIRSFANDRHALTCFFPATKGGK